MTRCMGSSRRWPGAADRRTATSTRSVPRAAVDPGPSRPGPTHRAHLRPPVSGSSRMHARPRGHRRGLRPPAHLGRRRRQLPDRDPVRAEPRRATSPGIRGAAFSRWDKYSVGEHPHRGVSAGGGYAQAAARAASEAGSDGPVREVVTKYSPGTRIADTKTNPPYLYVPPQTSPIPQAILDYAESLEPPVQIIDSAGRRYP